MTAPASRYFAYIRKSVKGPFYPKDMLQLPGFGRNTLVCPEAALGQWREAHLEKAFNLLLAGAEDDQGNSPPSLTHAAVEDKAVRSLLEKAILKNSQLEDEVKGLKREYSHEKKKFQEEAAKKDQEIKALSERLKRVSQAQSLQAGHPSWEQLYKTLKKRSDEKFSETAQELAEKKDEILRLRNQMQNMADNYEDSRRRTRDAAAGETADMEARLRELRSDLEEKDMVINNLAGSVQSTLNKNEEFQSIMLDERKDHEEQIKKFCDEIGRLRGELNWKQQEFDRLKAELLEAFDKIKEFESVDRLKEKEQDELHGLIRAKVKILSGYFESLEAKLRYTFKKA